MTMRWILFRAHHCDAKPRSAIKQAVNAAVEPFRSGNLSVESVAFVVVVLVTVRPTAEGVAEKHIAHARGLEGTLKRAAIEVRCEPAVRRGPHVRNRVNTCDVQELEELRQGVV